MDEERPRVTVPRPRSIEVVFGAPVRVADGSAGYRDGAPPLEVPASVTMTRRWAHGPVLRRGVFFVLSTALVFAWLVWLADDPSFTVFFATVGGLCLAPALYYVAAEALNWTAVVVGREALHVSHGPLPVAGARPVTLSVPSLTQVFVRRRVWGRGDAFVGYTLWARAAEQDVELVGRPMPLQDARFLEQTIEVHLGIEDDRPMGDV